MGKLTSSQRMKLSLGAASLPNHARKEFIQVFRKEKQKPGLTQSDKKELDEIISVFKRYVTK